MTANSKSILLLSQRYTPDSQALWRSAIELGWKTERIHNYQAPEWLKDEHVSIYGEGVFAFTIATQLGLRLIEPPLNWLVTLPEKYLLRDVNFLTLGEVRSLEQPKFIKPADGKLFEARVYPNGDELPAPEIQSDNTPVLTSEPIEWEIEFRFFITQRAVSTYSPYLINGELIHDFDNFDRKIDAEFALSFCNMILGDTTIALPPAFVLDVGKIKGRGWAVIEANPAWASGLYNSDPGKVLSLLSEACIKQSDLSDSDSQWIIDRFEDDH